MRFAIAVYESAFSAFYLTAVSSGSESDSSSSSSSSSSSDSDSSNEAKSKSEDARTKTGNVARVAKYALCVSVLS